MKEEIEQILMNNFTRGDIKTATEQLDKLFGGKFTEEWLAGYINKQALGGMDLKQYVTNLLYYAHVEAMSMSSIDFDKWVEEMVENIDDYYKVQLAEAGEEKRNKLIKAYSDLVIEIDKHKGTTLKEVKLRNKIANLKLEIIKKEKQWKRN